MLILCHRLAGPSVKPCVLLWYMCINISSGRHHCIHGRTTSGRARLAPHGGSNPTRTRRPLSLLPRMCLAAACVAHSCGGRQGLRRPACSPRTGRRRRLGQLARLGQLGRLGQAAAYTVGCYVLRRAQGSYTVSTSDGAVWYICRVSPIPPPAPGRC